jgi:hypothetical protein
MALPAAMHKNTCHSLSPPVNSFLRTAPCNDFEKLSRKILFAEKSSLLHTAYPPNIFQAFYFQCYNCYKYKKEILKYGKPVLTCFQQQVYMNG